jgi:hypothetical protein
VLALVEPLLCNALWISAFGSVLAIVISAAVPSAVVAITAAVLSAVVATNPLYNSSKKFIGNMFPFSSNQFRRIVSHPAPASRPTV